MRCIFHSTTLSVGSRQLVHSYKLWKVFFHLCHVDSIGHDWLLLGDVFPRDNDLGTISAICRNCSERNETLTKKMFQVRANFSGPKGSLVNNLSSSVDVSNFLAFEIFTTV